MKLNTIKICIALTLFIITLMIFIQTATFNGEPLKLLLIDLLKNI
jgi:hypothetical protein